MAATTKPLVATHIRDVGGLLLFSAPRTSCLIFAPRPRRKSQVDGTGSGNGVMAYSIAARVVEQNPGPGSKLQVQLRFGETIEDMLENMPDPADAPEWYSTPSSQEIHRGEREIMLDVSELCDRCSDAASDTVQLCR